jgi:hypothetical protein
MQKDDELERLDKLIQQYQDFIKTNSPKYKTKDDKQTPYSTQIPLPQVVLNNSTNNTAKK